MSKVRKALIYSSISQSLGKVLALISIVMVARLLTPPELGVFAIAAALVGVASELKSFGMGSYIVRQEKINKHTIASSIGATLIISWILGLLLLISAPFIEAYYGFEDIKLLIFILSISFFLSPFIGITQALLTRAFKFREQFFVTITAQIIVFITTIILIIFDFSYFSLAIAAALGTITELLLFYAVKPDKMSWKPSFKKLSFIMKFGFYLTLSNLFRKAAMSVPELIIGKQGSKSDVAMYSRAAGFMDFLGASLIQGVGPVATPYLSEQQRLGHHLELPYLKATMLVGAILWPVLAVASVASYPVILFMFGEQWIEAAPIASTLAFWTLGKSIHALSAPLLMTSGLEKTLFFKEMLLLILTIFFALIGYQSGLQGLAWAMVLASLCDFILTTLLLKLSLQFGFVRFLKYSYKNITLTFISFLTTYLLNIYMHFDEQTPILSLLAIFFVNGIVWALVVKVQKNPIWFELSRLLPAKVVK
jgi:O-antigen/teichoic acid export membrane protein